MENGSELHRLKPMENYDEVLFNKLYKSIKPLIKKLSKNVDERRYNVSKDIIQSYFTDKFLYVFNKYHSEFDETKLKAYIINSLVTFKNRLLRSAYNNQAEYNQSLSRLDDVYESSKELVDDEEETLIKEEQHNVFHAFMKENLSMDAYLLFTIQLNPPPFIRDRVKNDNSKASIIVMLEFFDLPKTKSNANFISKLRKEIEQNVEKAKTQLTIKV